MSFDYLREIVTAQLNKRVAAERRELAGSTADPGDYEAYFKEVFGGTVL